MLRVVAALFMGAIIVLTGFSAKEEPSGKNPRPSLDELIREMNEPLPPLERGPAVEAAPGQVPVTASSGREWVFPVLCFTIATLLLAAFLFEKYVSRLRALESAGFRYRPKPGGLASPMKEGRLAPAGGEPLNAPAPASLQTLGEFSSWPELLSAARAGNPVAKQILAGAPSHPALRFEFNSEDFRDNLALTRQLQFSAAWVETILATLRQTEMFDPVLQITSPLGEREIIPLTAETTLINRALGYQGLPPEIRRQLELRRWILIHTRKEGTEHPEILERFGTSPEADVCPRKPIARAAAAHGGSHHRARAAR